MGTQGREVVGAQVASEIAHHGEAARAFEGGEVVAAGQVRNLWDGVGLEEIAPGFGVLEAAHDTEDSKGDVVKEDAFAGDAGGGEDDSEGGEQDVSEQPMDCGRRAGNGNIARHWRGDYTMTFQGV